MRIFLALLVMGDGAVGLAPLGSSKMPEVPAQLQEPGLKVPATAWKWPRSWPFGLEAFEPPATDAPEDRVEVFDAAAKEAFAKHVISTLPSGAEKVLVLSGSGQDRENQNSLVPRDGAAYEEIWAGPREVVEIREEKELASLPSETFDAVILTNAAELLRDPRTSFREAWRVLKFGGKALCAFSTATTSKSEASKMWKDYDDAQRIWVVGSFFHFSAGAPAAIVQDDGLLKTEVWGAGWRNLKGYDYFDSAEKKSKKLSFQNLIAGNTDGDAATTNDADDQKKKAPLYVVQAQKPDRYAPGAGPTAALDAELWAAEAMDEDDKRLSATRILAALKKEADDFEAVDSSVEETLALSSAMALRKIYEIVKPMSRVIATPLLAQLAANLAPRWNLTSKDQPAALRQGLGLDAPKDTFWKPLGELTAALTIDDKLWLMADLVPLFNEHTYPTTTTTIAGGTTTDGNRLPVALAPVVPTLLPRTVAHLSKSLTDPKGQVTETDVQLLAVDLIARDYLPDAALKCRSIDDADDAAESFLAWLTTLAEADLKAALDERRGFRDAAETKFKLAEMDPETAKRDADDLKRAKRVEDMLNDIAQRQQLTAAKKPGSKGTLPFSGL